MGAAGEMKKASALFEKSTVYCLNLEEIPTGLYIVETGDLGKKLFIWERSNFETFNPMGLMF